MAALGGLGGLASEPGALLLVIKVTLLTFLVEPVRVLVFYVSGVDRLAATVAEGLKFVPVVFFEFVIEDEGCFLTPKDVVKSFAAAAPPFLYLFSLFLPALVFASIMIRLLDLVTGKKGKFMIKSKVCEVF